MKRTDEGNRDLGVSRWYFRQRRGVDAFTLIELLVVVAIIALLVAILLPSLKEAREQARVAVCQSNLHQLSISFYTYGEDARGQLPPLAYTGISYRIPPLWFELVSPYMGHRLIDRFGYNGPEKVGSYGNEVGGNGYMACPSKPPTMPPEAYWPQTYGVNYTTIFAFQAPLGAV